MRLRLWGMSGGSRRISGAPFHPAGDDEATNIKALRANGKMASALETPTGLPKQATLAVAAEFNGLVADAFALLFKSKNFHWHMSGPHLRDYHLMLDEQADQIFAAIDPLAERVRKIGQPTLRSISHVAKLSRVTDNNSSFVTPADKLAELVADNKSMAAAMRTAHALCEKHEDSGSASLLQVFIDETERRTWFFFDAGRRADDSGHCAIQHCRTRRRCEAGMAIQTGMTGHKGSKSAGRPLAFSTRFPSVGGVSRRHQVPRRGK